MKIHTWKIQGCLAIALAAMTCFTRAAAPATPQGFITARGFLDIGSGTTMPDLTNHARFPGSPDVLTYPTYFEWNGTGDITTPANNAYGDNYGVQMLGYFHPPSTGDYVFYLSSDDNGLLYLSTDDNPANKKLIAQETGWSNPRSWDVVGSGTLESKNSQTFTATEWPAKDTANGGAKITLTKGRAYYIEALMKEGSGGDNLAVAAADPGFLIDYTSPIPGTYLSTFDKTSGPLKVTLQPQSQTVNEGAAVSFTVAVDGTPPYTYQWLKDGRAIADATNFTYNLSRAHRTDNAKFAVRISGPSGTTTSDDAVLTVELDTVAPNVVLASTSLGKTVKIEYDEWVEPATATNKANYAIAGITFTDAILSDDGRTVTLGVSGNLPANFEVTLGGIKDFGGNAIPANTKVTGYTTGLAPNMISYWPLDVIEGTKTPDIISGYDLNLENMTSANLVSGRFGKCFEFDNTRKALLKRVHNPGDLLPIYNHVAFTVSIWVNGPVQVDHRVYCESSSKANQPMFSIGTHNTGADGTLDTYIRNNANTESTGGGFTGHHHHTGVPFDETWHHICYVQNSNATPRAVVYIDGVKDGVNPDPIWPQTIDTTTLGAIQRAASAAWFTGKIDDVAVWSRALDPDEINFLLTKGTPTPPPKVLPLVISSFVAELPAVAKGDSVTLRWDVSKDATTVDIQPDIGDVTTKTQIGVGSVTVSIAATKTYKMTVKRGNETVTSQLQVAAIDGIATGWNLLDNFDRYNVGGLPKPWGVSGVGVQVVNVNSNRMLSVAGGADTLAGLVLNDLAVKEGQQRTLFTRFYLPQAVAASGINQYLGLSDKGIRFFGDSDGELGPDVAFQNPSGNLEIGTWNGYGGAVEFASFSLQPQTVYNLWIDVRNDPIAEGDLFSVYIAKDGDANRTEIFNDYRSDRNPTPDPSDIIGYPTKPDLTVLHITGNTTTSSVYLDDIYLSKGGYNPTVPRAFGLTTPVGGGVDAPTLGAVRLEGTSLKFDIATQSGSTYVLESRASLSAGSWQTAQTIPGTGQKVTVSLSVSGDSQFYRVRAQ